MYGAQYTISPKRLNYSLQKSQSLTKVIPRGCLTDFHTNDFNLVGDNQQSFIDNSYIFYFFFTIESLFSNYTIKLEDKGKNQKIIQNCLQRSFCNRLLKFILLGGTSTDGSVRRAAFF